jgi:hypothetical protein
MGNQTVGRKEFTSEPATDDIYLGHPGPSGFFLQGTESGPSSPGPFSLFFAESRVINQQRPRHRDRPHHNLSGPVTSTGWIEADGTVHTVTGPQISYFPPTAQILQGGGGSCVSQHKSGRGRQWQSQDGDARSDCWSSRILSMASSSGIADTVSARCRHQKCWLPAPSLMFQNQ